MFASGAPAGVANLGDVNRGPATALATGLVVLCCGQPPALLLAGGKFACSLLLAIASGAPVGIAGPGIAGRGPATALATGLVVEVDLGCME